MLNSCVNNREYSVQSIWRHFVILNKMGHAGSSCFFRTHSKSTKLKRNQNKIIFWLTCIMFFTKPFQLRKMSLLMLDAPLRFHLCLRSIAFYTHPTIFKTFFLTFLELHLFFAENLKRINILLASLKTEMPTLNNPLVTGQQELPQAKLHCCFALYFCPGFCLLLKTYCFVSLLLR